MSLFLFMNVAEQRFYEDMLPCGLKLLVKEDSPKSIKAPL